MQLMMTRLELKLAQTHVALTGPTRQQVLHLMMTRLSYKADKFLREIQFEIRMNREAAVAFQNFQGAG